MEYYSTITKRLPVRLDSQFDISMYGADNLYPQRMNELMLRSPLLKSAVGILEDFINGSGWEINGDIVLNHKGETSTDLLNLVAEDFANYDGFSLHLNTNGLGEIAEIQHIPFEYCRLGLPTNEGVISEILVSNNWEQDGDKLPKGAYLKPKAYPIFSPLTAGKETLDSKTPKGQVLYYTKVKNKYPLTTYDAIRDTGETDAAIQLYEKNNTNKGFHGATVFKYPGEFNSEEQKHEMRTMLGDMMGPDGPGIVLAQTDEDFSGTLMESIPSASDDALFSLTLDSILNRCLQNYNIPPALYGVAPTGGVFTQLAYQESFIVYNVLTRNKRKEVERVFNKISQLWHEESFLLGHIKENVFDVISPENEKIMNRLSGPTNEQLEKVQPDLAEKVIKPKTGNDTTQ